MKSIDQYLDAAKATTRTASDRQLSFVLGVSAGTVSQIRTKRIWPSDNLMITIAKQAKLDPAQALIDLNIWRNTGAARAAYERLSKYISAAAIAFMLIIPGQPKPAEAKELSVYSSGDMSPHTIRYLKFKAYLGQVLRDLRSLKIRAVNVYKSVSKFAGV